MPDKFAQDLRYAMRALKASPGFAAVAILSLALGIGANTAIFSLIDSVMLKSLPVGHPEQLVRVSMGDKGGGIFTNPIWEAVRDRQDVFSGIFAYGTNQFDLASGGEARYAQGYFVAGQFFETLGLQPVLGRMLSTADDKRGCPGTAVLGYGFWQSEYGGRADIVGKSISLDNHPFEVVGVLGPGFSGLDVGRAQQIYLPLCSEKIVHGEASMLDRRSTWWMVVMGRPKAGVSASQATARLNTLAPEIFKATLPPNWSADNKADYLKRTFRSEPVANGVSDLRTDYSKALTILIAITGVVLLIACANVANLLLARSAGRQREIAIRIALGSGRGRLMRQLLTESLVLSLGGAALGVLFAQWGSSLLVRFLSTHGSQVYLDLGVNMRVLAFTAAIGVLTGLLFGLAPAWKGTRVDPQSAMKANSRGVIEGSRFGLGKALVVLQVALSMVLVVAAGLMLTTFFRLEKLDPGFDRERVLLVAVDLRNGNYPTEQRGPVFQRMLDRMRGVPGVRYAAGASITPISGSWWDEELEIEGYTGKGADVYFNQVTDGYFETLGAKVIAGRDFNAHDTPQAPRVALVNQMFAKKYFAGSSPMGKRYRAVEGNTMGPWTEIIGIVSDSKYGTIRDEAPPTAYLAMSQETKPLTARNYVLNIASGAPAGAISAVKSAMAEVNPNITLEFATLATQVDESLNKERLLATLSGFFGGLALLLATIGLYGVMSYNVARRRNEIGIRMALGAEQARVLRMVLREVLVLILCGLAVGLAATLATTRFVESFLYGMKPNDPLTLGIAAGTLALVAMVAGFLPARRASRLDPMTALREE
jgi:predicted permease